MTLTVHHGDCTDILPTLAPGSVQCIVTSPPYFGLRDYGIAPTEWPAVTFTPMPGLPPLTIPAQTVCLGLESDPLAYTAHLVHVFRLARPALRDDAVAWLNLGDCYVASAPGVKGVSDKSGLNGANTSQRYRETLEQSVGKTSDKTKCGIASKNLMLIPARVALALQADGWYVRSQVIWHKPNAMPESVTDRPTNDYEPVYLLAKSARYYFDAAAIAEPQIKGAAGSRFDAGKTGTNGMGRVSTAPRVERETRNRRAVWRISTEALRDEHYAPMPSALVEPCILAGSAPRACEVCGAPWARVVERETSGVNDTRTQRGLPEGKMGHKTRMGDVSTRDLGWQPTCTCPDATGSGSCVVLDPFFGSGTVGAVALQYGRACIGIDKNDRYIAMSERRTNGVQIHMEALL